MRASRSLGPLATFLLSASPLAAASVWPAWLPALDALVVVRAESPSSTAAQTSTPTATDKKSDPTTTVNLNTGSVPTDSPTTATGKSNTTRAATHTTFDPTDYPGSVVIINPPTTQISPLYKIGDFVTFQWNYTNLLATPTAVDVLASCSANSQTYTLTQNMTFATNAAYTWDTNNYQNSAKATPLLTEQYTLIIYDADSSVSATGEPGYLNTFNGLPFGMYLPQAYTPLADGWQCASCNAGVSDTDRRALGFMLTMSLITVLSFTWFVTGLL